MVKPHWDVPVESRCGGAPMRLLKRRGRSVRLKREMEQDEGSKGTSPNRVIEGRVFT